MKPAVIAQGLFVLAASFAAFAFVRAARNDLLLTSCSAVCELGPAYAGNDRLAPDFELPDMNGRPVRLSSFFGQPIVLNFWTQTCEPCKKELPSLGQLALLGREHGIVLLTVSADDGPDDVRATLQAIFRGGEPPFPILFDPELQVIQAKYGTVLYPETWIIDASHIIRARFDGERNWYAPLAREAIDKLSKPGGCRVDFVSSTPVGPFAKLCPLH
jgi:peroxiredoxin